jgi:RHS repeat-associated protein
MLSNTYAENQYKFNGMKFNKEFELNQYQTYYRSNDPAIGRWYGYDRKASYSISPYASMNDNPISKVDPMGDTILVAFVVEGKPVEIMYNYGTGKFVNRNGTPLEYKANQVLPKAVMNALWTIRRTDMGNRVVKDLSNSKNIFTIKDYRESNKGYHTHFEESNVDGAYGLMAINDPYSVRGMLGGSGGTIYFDTDGQGILTVAGELSKEPISELAHEMYHAYEANNGLTDPEPGSNGSPLPGAEYRAAFFENIIRQFLNLDLRGTYHTHDNDGNPTQRRLTNDEGQPIWVPIIIRPSLERFPPK